MGENQTSTNNGPLYILACIIVFSLMALAAVLINISSAYKVYRSEQGALLESKAMESQILYYNGLMTNAAQMHVLTGEMEWKRNYQAYKKQASNVFEKLEAHAPKIIALYAEKTNSAHDRILDIHQSAFLLADAGFKEEATDMLIGYENQTYSAILDENIQLIGKGVDELVSNEMEILQGSLASKVFYAAVILLIVSIGWMIAWIMLRKWQRAITESEAQKDEALHSLEISSRRVERSRAEYQAVIEYAADGIMTIQAGGEISSCNKSALQIFRESETHILRKNIQEMIPDMAKEVTDGPFNVKRYVKETDSARKEYEILTDDGYRVPIELSISRIYFEGRESYTAMLRDISAEKRAESERKKSDAKSQFLANMSHELRTPMNGVIGMTDLLLQGELEAEQEEFASTIKKSAESLQSVINDILDFSKIEAGALSLEPISFDLSGLVDDVADIFAASAEEKNIDLAVRFDPSTARHIMADPGRVKQVLTNLINNAIKFTEEGHILINVQEYAHITDKRVLLKFEVEDTGIGIPQDRVDDVFGRFTQADESTTRKFGGTGLGLAISKQLVEIMGGDIGLRSTLGVGSTFWFTMEVEKDLEAEEAVEYPNLEGMTVLSVSRKSLTNSIIKGYVEHWGGKFVSAASIEEAALLPERKFDVLLKEFFVSDYMETELSSITEMCNQCCSGVQKVALVPISMRGNYKMFEEKGFQGLLAKPFKDKDILELLKLIKGGEEQFITSQLLRKTEGGLKYSGMRRDYNVLVVEDDLVNQKVAEKILEGFGCTVTIASNGQEALDRIETTDFDFALMDMQMPIMDGLTATRIIRENETKAPYKPSLYIIALTANASKTDKERCLDVGMDGFLTKPVTSEKVLQSIKHWEEHGGSSHTLAVSDGNGKVEEEEKTEDIALFDMERFEDITMGDKELQVTVLEAYEKSLEEGFEILKNEHVGSEGWISIAHKMKGSSLNIGANSFAKMCEKAEQKPSEFEENGKMEELEHLYTQTIDIVQGMRNA